MRRAGRALAVALMIVGVLFPMTTASAVTKTWTGASSTAWAVAGNWSPSGVPVAGDDVVIPDVTNDPTVSDAQTVTSVTVQNGGALTVATGATLTVTGAITVDSGGTLTHSAGTINAGGNVSVAGTGSFNSSATVNFNGAGAQSILGNGTTMNVGNFTVAKTGGSTLTLSRNVSVSGNLTMTTGILDLGANTANRASAGGTLSVASGATLRIGGTNSLPSDYATYTFGATSTVEYYGANQTIADEAYGHLTVSGTGTKTPAADLGIAGNLTVSGTATLDLHTFTATGGGSSTLSVGSGATLKIGGDFPTGYTTTTFDSASTVNYSKGGAQAIAADGYGNLTLSGSGTKTAAGILTIAGNMTLSGAAFAHGGFKVTFNGAATQTISGADVTFDDLEINNSVGVASSALVLGGGDVTVDGTFTLTSGRVTTGGNRVVANTTPISGGGSSSYVDGNLREAITTSVGSQTVVFPIGAGPSYTPVSVTFPSGVTSTSGTLTFSSTTGTHPQIATSGLNAAQGVARYWTGNALGLSGFTTYNATFNFVNPGDLVGGPNTATLQIRKYDAPNWTAPPGSTSSNSTSATGTGFTSFSDFAVGNTGAGGCSDGTFSGTVTSPGVADTDCSNDGATASVPVETVVTRPAGGSSGTVTITNAAPSGGPSGYTLFGRQVSITVPAAGSPSNFHLITFYIDSSVIPAGYSAANINVFKDSATSPVGGCSGGTASPDPCVASRTTGTGVDAGDAVITIRSSTASLWRFATTGCNDGNFSGTLGPAGTADTDCSGNGATTTAPVETSLFSPPGGAVTITASTPSGGPSGYSFLGRQVAISATAASSTSSPLVITFTLDSSVLPAGGVSAIVVFKDAAVVPACTGPGASPNPCVTSRSILLGGDGQIRVYTTTASTWRFGVVAAQKCAGLSVPAANVYGSGNDVIYGTSGNDVIYAGAGNDTVYGLGGNDTICLGPGDDKAYGDDGDDTILGGSGADQIWGGAGNDTIKGRSGADKLYGKSGNDTLKGQGGDDFLSGQGGNDILRGARGDDTLSGGRGTDYGYGGSGSDSCTGVEYPTSC